MSNAALEAEMRLTFSFEIVLDVQGVKIYNKLFVSLQVLGPFKTGNAALQELTEYG